MVIGMLLFFGLIGPAVASEGLLDEAMNALVEGRDAAALSALRRGLSDDPDHEIRCLLGKIALRTGRPGEALDVLGAVPEDAPCARQAAFGRAEALAALGRTDEAAAVYEALADDVLGEDRHRDTAERLVAWADRLLSNELQGNEAQAARLLELALTLDLAPDRRLELARRVARLAKGARHLGQSGATMGVLAEHIAAATDLAPAERRLLAPLLDPRAGLELLAPLPDGPVTQRLRVQLVQDRDLVTATALAEPLLARWPDSPEAREVRLELGERLADRGFVDPARELLAPVRTGEDDDAARADWILAKLAVRVGEPEAEQGLVELLARFPVAGFRRDAEALLSALRLDGARRLARAEPADPGGFEAVVASRPEDAQLALEMAWALRGEAQLDQLEEVAARWPHLAHEALTARVQLDEEGGWGWLEAQVASGRPYAAEVREALSTPELVGIRTPGRQARTPVVQVGARGVEEVEMRLHPIDLEGYVRAGRGPSELALLDVGIVAPERTWTVALSDPGKGRQAWHDVAVPVRKPGLYAVAAATADEEARTFLLVSDIELVARRVGDQLVAVAFRDGRPVGGARILAAGESGVVTGRADGSGLARLTVPDGPLVVLAETPGGPALLEVEASDGDLEEELRVAVDLDRPVYRPGDVVRFRALATLGSEALRGTWRVGLRGQVSHDTVRLETGPFGAVRGEVVVPLRAGGLDRAGAIEQRLTLVGLPPGRDEEVVLAQIAVLDEAVGGRALTLAHQEEGVRITVVDGRGVPAAQVPVQIAGLPGGERLVHTDLAGQVDVEAPPLGVPWTLVAQIPGTTVRGSLSAKPPDAELELRLDPEDRLALEGTPGRIRVQVFRQDEPWEATEALIAPHQFVSEALTSWERQVADGPVVGALLRPVHQVEVDLGEDPVSLALPDLPPGHYRAYALAPDGRVLAESVEVHVPEGPTVRLDGAPRVGGAAPVRVDGGYALVTVEGGRLLDAAVVRPGQVWLPRVDRRWHGEVQLVASEPGSQHVRTVSVDAHLDVDLSVDPSDDTWQIDVLVTDAAGHPADAEVLVRALDEELIDEMGAPYTLSLAPFLSTGIARGVGAVAQTLEAAFPGLPIAAALRDEAMRVAEARKARKAAKGELVDPKVRALLKDEVPLASQGVGLSGMGSGGAGYGHGSGHFGRAVGASAGKAMSLGDRARVLRGAREGRWVLLRTDAQGRVRVRLPAAEDGNTWRIEAVALGRDAVGQAREVVEPLDRPRLVLDPVAPGWPGDVARPRVRVVGSEAGGAVSLGIDGQKQALDLGPGEVRVVELPETQAGRGVAVVLERDGQVVEEQRWSFPLAAGEPDADGEIAVALVGRPAGTLLGALALAEDPLAVRDVMRAAVMGRSALAALDRLSGAERAEALRRIRAAVGAVRERPPTSPRAAAQALLLVAEAAPVLGLPRSAVDAMRDAVGQVEPTTPMDRVELSWARAVAAGEVEQATLGRLTRDVALLDPEGRALLARLAARLGERPDPAWVSGVGPEAVLAGGVRGVTPVGPERLLEQAPPPIGSPARPSYVRAVAHLLVRPAVSPSESGFARGEVPAGALLRWRERAPAPEEEAERAEAGRVPVRLDGLAASIGVEVPCGTEQAPCRLAVDEALAVSVRWPDGWAPTGGLRPSLDRRVLVATTPGRYRLLGLRDREGARLAPLHVVVGEVDEAQLGEEGLVARAEDAWLSGGDPLRWLALRPSLEAWSPRLRTQVARLRFNASADADPADRVAAFEDLRDEAPSTAIALDRVADTARAYRSNGRPDRAIGVWRRALGAGFLDEAHVVGQLGAVVGELAAVQALREAIARYPEVPLVEEAAFALPDRLLDLAESPPSEVVARGVTGTDIRLLAASWDRDFVALHPGSALVPEAGLRLATGLYALEARERALGWCQRLRAAHPEHELFDRWLLLEALILTDLGRSTEARRALRGLAEEEVPLGGGRVGPSALRDDARFGLARLAEASDDPVAAREWYRAVLSSVPEAALALQALDAVSLEAEPVLRVQAGEPVKVEVRAVNVEEVHVSAFAVDLRTLFLRESGLPSADALRVEGLAPVWTGSQRLGAGPFPETHDVRLPVSGPGAWLVRIDGDGVGAASLVVRSGLELATTDGSQRRVALRLGGKPAAGVAVRAVTGSGILALKSDARGVAVVPPGASVLAQHEAHYAFTEDPQDAWAPAAPAAYPQQQDVLMERLNSREAQRRMDNRMRYDFIGEEASGAIEASQL